MFEINTTWPFIVFKIASRLYTKHKKLCNVSFISQTAHLNKNLKDKIDLTILAANNHYSNYGPWTANVFRKILGLEESIWEINLALLVVL